MPGGEGGSWNLPRGHPYDIVWISLALPRPAAARRLAAAAWRAPATTDPESSSGRAMSRGRRSAGKQPGGGRRDGRVGWEGLPARKHGLVERRWSSAASDLYERAAPVTAARRSTSSVGAHGPGVCGVARTNLERFGSSDRRPAMGAGCCFCRGRSKGEHVWGGEHNLALARDRSGVIARGRGNVPGRGGWGVSEERWTRRSFESCSA